MEKRKEKDRGYKNSKKKKKKQRQRIWRGMCKLSLLFIAFCLFVILVSLMLDIKRQRNCLFFFSPNFVYSVIINQSRGMTRLLGSDRQKEYVERLTWKKKKDRKRERGMENGISLK